MMGSFKYVHSLVAAGLAIMLMAGCAGTGANATNQAKAEYAYKLASNYYADRNIAMTQRELHNALKLDPNHVQALNLRGFVRLGLKDIGGAIADFQQVLNLDPDFQEARNNLGSALIAQGRYHEAIEVLEPLLEDPLYPTPAFAQGNVGWAYFQLQQYADAKRHTAMAVFLNPRFCVGLNNLGQICKAMGDIREAVSNLEKAIKTCPMYAEPYYHLGVIYQEMGQLTEATAAFAKCVELAPETALGKRCAIRQ